MRPRRLAWTAAVFAALSLAVTPSFAGPSARDRAEAKKLSAAAQAAYKKRRFDVAVEAYRHADQLSPSPQTKLGLARALVGNGKLLEASEILRSLQEAPATSAAAKRAQSTAARLQKQLKPRIPSLQVIVTGPSGGARTLVDERELDAAAEPTPIDPGAHVVVVEAPGFRRAERRISAVEGERVTVPIALEETEEAAARPTAARRAPAEDKPHGRSKVPAAIAFGLGAVGVGVGTAFGLLALSETSAAKDRCDGNVCPNDPDTVSARDAALRYGNISTVGFIAGGACVATGVVLLIVASAPRAAPSGGATSTAVRPWIGAGQAGVAGAF